MARKPPPPRNSRNGLKWRDGRPRWEPSPASRAAGIKGLDLKDLDGAWVADRGEAISYCDARQALAQLVREALQDGPQGEEGASDLRRLLGGLQAPPEPAKRLRRLLVQDLIDKGHAVLAGQDAAAGVSLTRAPRTAERLAEAYFAAVDAGEVKIKLNTRKAYEVHARVFAKKFAGRPVASIRRAELIAWYADLLETESVASANMRLGTAGALFHFAWGQEWISASPAVKLGRKKAKGRRVYWTLEEERSFVPWCDANGFADVGDGVTLGAWSGARPIDMCAADLKDLAGEVWRFVPIKTEKAEQDAMPALLEAVKARVDRRRLEAASDPVRYLNTTPFLYDARNRRRHDTESLWRRFVKAKALYLAQGGLESLAGKKIQDLRDTCITRLYAAGVAIARMWTWTGHAQESIEEILREHYLVLLEEGQLEMARQLEAWAVKEAVKL